MLFILNIKIYSAFHFVAIPLSGTGLVHDESSVGGYQKGGRDAAGVELPLHGLANGVHRYGVTLLREERF